MKPVGKCGSQTALTITRLPTSDESNFYAFTASTRPSSYGSRMPLSSQLICSKKPAPGRHRTELKPQTVDAAKLVSLCYSAPQEVKEQTEIRSPPGLPQANQGEGLTLPPRTRQSNPQPSFTGQCHTRPTPLDNGGSWWCPFSQVCWDAGEDGPQTARLGPTVRPQHMFQAWPQSFIH